MEEDGFQLVKRGTRGPKKGPRKGRTFLDRCHGLDEFAALKSTINIGSICIDSIEELRKQINKCCVDLRHECYLKQIMSSMGAACPQMASPPHFEEIVCFGLGNFSRDITSLYQLAVLVAMNNELKYSSKVTLYDPCFTEFELAALHSLNFHILTNNTECRYPVSSHTLFFMPHMYAIHYNNVVQSNWTGLELVVLYCNSFEHLLSVVTESEFEYLLKLQNNERYEINEAKIKNQFSFLDCFNNLSIHSFTRKNMSP